MCKEFYTKGIINRKKGIFFFFFFFSIFEKVYLFIIPNFSIKFKVVPLIYAIVYNKFLKNFVLEEMEFMLVVNADFKD